LVGAVGLLAPAIAHAGGFDIPDTGARAAGRGGAFAVAADDLTALHYNPGKLATQRGTTFLYNHSLIFHRATFQRDTLSSAWGPDEGTEFGLARDRKKLFPLGLFAVLASDFGLENWTFAAGVYGPSAVGRLDYADYGPQSFMLTDLNVLMAYYNVAAAWKLRDVFGIGATIQYVDLIQMEYGLVADSTTTEGLDPVPDGMSTQLVTNLELKDRTAATALLGLWYRPHRRVELGLAGRIVPVFLRPKGGVEVDKSTLVTDEISVAMKLVLPATLRGGVRYIHPHKDGEHDLFDLELDVFWENWSSIKRFDLDFQGEISGLPVQDIKVPKQWRDTVSVRLGGDVHAIPEHLTVRAGGFFESGAMPKAYSNLDFPSFNRGGIGLGLSGGGKGVYVSVAYMHIFQETRSITELQSKVFQQRPLRPCPDQCGGLSGVPANSGEFRSSYDLLNLGIELKFSEMVAAHRARKKGKSSPPAKPTLAPATTTSAPAAEPSRETAPTSEPEPTTEPSDAPTGDPAVDDAASPPA
jgi:long-subunit fatty acid transport protein